jgi:VWFA-related protein
MRRMKRKTVGLLMLAGLLSAGFSIMSAQKLSVDVNLTMLRSQVVDERGEAVLNLTADDFELLENGKAMPINHFLVNTGSAEIGFLADTSLSVRPSREDLKQTIGQFVSHMASDRAFLMSFAGDTQLLVPATYDLAAVSKGLGKLTPSAGSRFYDAVLNGLDELVKSRKDRKALIILTDGADHYSAHTFEQLLKTATLYGCEIYIIAYPGDDSRTWTDAGRSEIRSEFFQLASASGGQAFFPASLSESSRIAKRVVELLHYEYRFDFYSSVPFNEPSEVRIRIRGDRGEHLYVHSSIVRGSLP